MDKHLSDAVIESLLSQLHRFKGQNTNDIFVAERLCGI